jgi:hypothetical protein
VRLGLLAFCGGLLLLLSSRPADAAERQGPGLLDPVGATLKAAAREVDSSAGRATGSGSSAVAKVADTVRRTVAPPSRPAAPAVRAAATTVKRGAPAVTSPVRRVAPPTSQLTRPARPATRSLGGAAEATAGPLGLAALAAVLLLLGPVVRGRARPERPGTLSRSYLPFVPPA